MTSRTCGRRAAEPWNAHVKDKLEDRLHNLVCSGRMRLEDAQRDIAQAGLPVGCNLGFHSRPLQALAP
jgi:hypothetical protein